MKYILSGGTVISGNDTKKADLLIENGKIKKIEPGIVEPNTVMVDVSGKLVFPGFIDPHTHFDLEVSGTVTADDFYSGTRAAVAGGTTTIIDFATQNKGETLKEGLENWHKKSEGKCFCDYGFHMAISSWNDQVSMEIEDMMKLGVSSFKVYMTYDAMFLKDAQIHQVLKRVKEVDGLVGVHCENKDLIDVLVARKKEKGLLSPSEYPKTRTPETEREAISRLLYLARTADAPVMVVHLSSAQGLEEIEQTRLADQVVYAETCPQYLLLDESYYNQDPKESRKYILAPPLRAKENQEALWDAIKRGAIDTVATDHCSFTKAQKEVGASDFTKVPCGMPGVETRAELLYTFGVKEGKISLEQMCKVLSENPAKLYGMYPQKGVLLPGSDADLVIWDPEKEWTYTDDNGLSKSDYHPYCGLKIKGKAEHVFLRGIPVVQNGVVQKETHGHFIKRGE